MNGVPLSLAIFHGMPHLGIMSFSSALATMLEMLQPT